MLAIHLRAKGQGELRCRYRAHKTSPRGAARARFYSESMKAGTNTPACADRVTNIPGFLMVDERPRSVTSVITTSATSAGTSPLPLKIFRKPFLKP
jgi:hypothetical protein